MENCENYNEKFTEFKKCYESEDDFKDLIEHIINLFNARLPHNSHCLYVYACFVLFICLCIYRVVCFFVSSFFVCESIGSVFFFKHFFPNIHQPIHFEFSSFIYLLSILLQKVKKSKVLYEILHQRVSIS